MHINLLKLTRKAMALIGETKGQYRGMKWASSSNVHIIGGVHSIVPLWQHFAPPQKLSFVYMKLSSPSLSILFIP